VRRLSFYLEGIECGLDAGIQVVSTETHCCGLGLGSTGKAGGGGRGVTRGGGAWQPGAGKVMLQPFLPVETLAMQAAYLMEPCRSEYAAGLRAQAVCQADQGDNGLPEAWHAGPGVGLNTSGMRYACLRRQLHSIPSA
jgi:hypothetical protein